LRHIKGVRKIFGQEEFKGKPALILEYIEEQTLEEYAASTELSIRSRLRLAISLAAILSEIHGQNIIHRDVNSRNILISSKGKTVYICDFGIASRIAGQMDIKARPEEILGTLPYISPEQTGRLNRFVDERADLYSLGVVLYRLMAGQLPFSAESPMEWIHRHIARMPVEPAVINPKIPDVLSSIILKLLAKDPEERYQTAHGVRADLEQCLKHLQKDGTIPPFSIAQDDISGRFRIPKKLYGREPEMEFLQKAFERAARGEPGLVLVSGHPGRGKTALVEGLKQQVAAQKGFFIEGKFDQYLQSTPYTAIAQAFEQFAAFILAEPEDQFHKWRDTILSSTEGMGKVISEIIPRLEFITGPQSAIPPLSGQDAQKRLHYTFFRFIRAIATAEHPLVLFLDDLQWIDPASLNLLKTIAMDAERHSLLIIGAYRDNEVDVSHPLMPMLDVLKKEGRDIRALSLDNLQVHQLEDLLTDTLKTGKEVAGLARLLYEKTNGNPFFTRRLLKKLKEEGQFTFDTAERKWQYTMGAISSQPISENVVLLLSETLLSLPVDTRQILKQAAYIGNRFDLSTLSVISEQTEEAIKKALVPAFSEKIIIASGETCLFAHDLIQQTAYQLSEEGEKEALHLHIGRVLLNQWSGEQRLENIFTLADHLNAGHALIQKEEERTGLADLNLHAGTKAKDTGAFAAARNYFREGVRNLPANTWETDYRLAFELNRGLAEAEFLNGDLEKSEELIHATLSRIKLPVEKAQMYNLLIMLHTLNAEQEKARDVGKHALNLLGFRLPEDNLKTVIKEEIVEVKKKLENRSIASLLDTPGITDPDKRQVGLLLGNMVSPCFLLGDPLWAVAVTKLVKLALEFGNIPEFLYGYALFGAALSILTKDYQSGYDLCQLSIELCKRHHNHSQLARACEVLGNHVLHWVKPCLFSTMDTRRPWNQENWFMVVTYPA
ncbi:MAG: ATP-binding protein, partial [Desulfobacteria bacterium]